jgi:uncharacterized protein
MECSNGKAAHSMNGDCTLVVMAKAPRPGMVKTRLAQSLQVGKVTELYHCFFDDTMALASSLGTVEVAIMCPASDVEELTRLAPPEVGVVAQEGEGLAAGLTSVFAHFAANGERRIVAFNCDSPHLPAPVLVGAFEALAGCDVVVGPTQDGGYYLVGAKADHPTLFAGGVMGTKSALEALLARASGLQLSVGLTETFYDIDVEDDLIRLAAELRRDPARAPRTAVWLKQWGHAVEQLRAGAGEL